MKIQNKPLIKAQDRIMNLLILIDLFFESRPKDIISTAIQQNRKKRMAESKHYLEVSISSTSSQITERDIIMSWKYLRFTEIYRRYQRYFLMVTDRSGDRHSGVLIKPIASLVIELREKAGPI